MLIYWLWGVILIYRPCGAEFLAPGCYFDRPALWCWLVGSGMLFQLTVPVVLIWCLKDAILVDSHPPWYDFGRPALWCWFKGSGVLFWYTGPVVLICWCWLVGSGLLFQLTGSMVLICWLWDVVLVDNLAHRYSFYRLALWCWLVLAPGCYFDSPALLCWFFGSGVVCW